MPLAPLNQEDLIELWRRVLPNSYTVPIENEQSGQGFDIPSAQAIIFAQVDVEANETFQSHFLKPSPIQTDEPASGPTKAEVQIDILRNASTVGDLDLSLGTLLLAEQTGTIGQTIRLVDFELVDDVTMPEGDRGPIQATVRATIEGYAGNVAAGSIESFLELGRASVTPCTILTTTTVQRTDPPPAGGATDRFHLGHVKRFINFIGLPSGIQAPRKILSVDEVSQVVIFDTPLPVGDVSASGLVCEIVELSDLGLEVTQSDPAVGGSLGMLDAIGFDRKTGRVVGESDDAYRDRICELSDTISPGAVDRITEAILEPCGICFSIKETREISTLKGFVWDLDPFDFGQVPPVPNNGVGDLVGEGAVLLDKSMAFSFFMICVGLTNDGEFGAAYDTTAPGLDPPNAWGQFFWDGSPVEYESCIGQLHAAIDGVRAAGVNFLIFQDPSLTGTC